MASDDKMIAALLRERAGYEAHGKTDRVRQVDEQLAHYGYEPEGEQKKAPQGRTSAPQQTADQAPTKRAARKTTAKKTTAASQPETPTPADPADEASTQAAPPSAE